MKIGFDIRSLMDQNYSGVSFYTLNLLKALLNLDRENEYFLFYNASRPVKLPIIKRDNVHYRGFRYPNKFFNLSLALTRRPRLDYLLGKIDVFFAPSLNFISWSNQVRKIITVHDLSFLFWPEFFTFKSRSWHWLVGWRRLISEADCVIADSFNTQRDLVEFLGVDPEKIKVVYLGIDENFKKISPEDPRLAAVKTRYQLPENFILSLGTLEPRKNLMAVIEAYQKLSPAGVDLIIAGPKGWRTGAISRLVKNHPHIRFLGYVAEADKPIFYNLARCLIYPSYYEGFGLPPLEAMASGCPVIVGHNSSLLEVVAEAGILVDPYNLNDLKKALNLILTDYNFRQALIDRGLDRAKNYSWEKAATEILNIFQKYS